MTARLILSGLNHRSAPLKVRERAAVSATRLTAVLAELRTELGLDEVVLLSTCNRTEIYGVAGAESTEHRSSAAPAPDLWLDRLAGDAVTRHVYVHEDTPAVSHLFRVAAGLDSMVLGECEVLGQVKGAYAAARTARTTGPLLNALFQRALRVGSRARTETDISANVVSVPSVALSLTHKVFADLGGKRALLIGTGEVGRVALKHLVEAGLGEIVAANRTLARAEAALQQLEAAAADRPVRYRAIDIQGVPAALTEVDIVLACSEAPHYVIGPAEAARATASRRGRPLVLIDLGVPRQIDPAVGRSEGAYLFDIDDLHQVVEENLAERRREAAKVERIVSEEVAAFECWRRRRRAAPVIRRLRAEAEAIRLEEVERLLAALDLSPRQREVLTAFSYRLTNRLLDYPTVTLRELAAEGEGQAAIDLVVARRRGR